MDREFRCESCKWFMNAEHMTYMTKEEIENYFRFSCCGSGSDYYCVVSDYSLYEKKENK